MSLALEHIFGSKQAEVWVELQRGFALGQGCDRLRQEMVQDRLPAGEQEVRTYCQK